MTTRLFRTVLAVLATTAVVLGLGIGVASAHVSVSSTDAAPGGFGEITFRVPTESDTASTVSLRVEVPTDPPIADVSIKPIPGWTATTKTTKLDQPVKDDDGNEVTEAVSEVNWKADTPDAGIKPGQYQDFSISAGPLPDVEKLTFPAIQGYDDGSEVQWIDPSVDGQAEPEHPAPVLTLASSSDGNGGTTGTSTASSESSSSDSGTSGVAVTALVLAIIGAVAGLAALAMTLMSRRRGSSA